MILLAATYICLFLIFFIWWGPTFVYEQHIISLLNFLLRFYVLIYFSFFLILHLITVVCQRTSLWLLIGIRFAFLNYKWLKDLFFLDELFLFSSLNECRLIYMIFYLWQRFKLRIGGCYYWLLLLLAGIGFFCYAWLFSFWVYVGLCICERRNLSIIFMFDWQSWFILGFLQGCSFSVRINLRIYRFWFFQILLIFHFL